MPYGPSCSRALMVSSTVCEVKETVFFYIYKYKSLKRKTKTP